MTHPSSSNPFKVSLASTDETHRNSDRRQNPASPNIGIVPDGMKSPQTLALALHLSCIKMDAMRNFTTVYKQSGPLSKAGAFKAPFGMPLPRGAYAMRQKRCQLSSCLLRNSNRQIRRIETHLSHCKQRRELYSNRQKPRHFPAPLGGSFRGTN